MQKDDRCIHQRIFVWSIWGALLGGLAGLLLGFVLFYAPDLFAGLAPVSMASPVVTAVAGTWLGIVVGVLLAVMMALVLGLVLPRGQAHSCPDLHSKQ